MHTGINNSKIEFEDAFEKKPIVFDLNKTKFNVKNSNIYTKKIMSFFSLQLMCCRVFSKILKIKRNIFSTLFQTKTTTKSQIYLLEKTSEKGENNRGEKWRVTCLGRLVCFQLSTKTEKKQNQICCFNYATMCAFIWSLYWMTLHDQMTLY